MRRIVIRLAVLAVVAYLVFTRLVPWLKESGEFGAHRAGAASASAGSDSECVASAMRAPELFSSEIRGFARPPIDEAAWDQAWDRISRRIDDADSACDCSFSSCGKAREALGELRSLAGDYDYAFREGGSPPLNGARTLSGIWDLLNEADNLSRQGD